MKTWEVIKALHDNPKLQFKNKRIGRIAGYRENGSLGYIDGPVDDGLLTIHYKPEHPKAYGGGNWDDDWEPAPQPVPFMEAVKAYRENKNTIMYKLDGNHWYTPSEDSPTWNDDDTQIPVKAILHGTWYIVEGEEG